MNLYKVGVSSLSSICWPGTSGQADGSNRWRSSNRWAGPGGEGGERGARAGVGFETLGAGWGRHVRPVPLLAALRMAHNTEARGPAVCGARLDQQRIMGASERKEEGAGWLGVPCVGKIGSRCVDAPRTQGREYSVVQVRAEGANSLGAEHGAGLGSNGRGAGGEWGAGALLCHSRCSTLCEAGGTAGADTVGKPAVLGRRPMRRRPINKATPAAHRWGWGGGVSALLLRYRLLRLCVLLCCATAVLCCCCATAVLCYCCATAVLCCLPSKGSRCPSWIDGYGSAGRAVEEFLNHGTNPVRGLCVCLDRLSGCRSCQVGWGFG